MSWSKEWKNSEGFVERIGKAFDKEFPNVDTHWKVDVKPDPPITTYPAKTIVVAGKPVHVIVVGDLGLELLEDGRKFIMHHLPTLASFNSAVPCCFKLTGEKFTSHENIAKECCEYEIDDLIKWMKKVQENYPTSWQMLRLLTPETYVDKGESAKRIIKEWCLSVPVETS
jgi:hypothetical protein